MFWDFEEPAVLFETAGFLFSGVFRMVLVEPVLWGPFKGFFVYISDKRRPNKRRWSRR
jgi:hypothetical protein